MFNTFVDIIQKKYDVDFFFPNGSCHLSAYVLLMSQLVMYCRKRHYKSCDL